MDKRDASNSKRNHVRMAHLSDIHLHPKLPMHRWERVVQLLRQDSPDLLVVSGDFVQHPSPFSLALARRELVKLSEELGCSLFTIPGNHDVAFFGSIRVPVFTALYERIFNLKADKVFRNFPTFSEFRAKSKLARLRSRLYWYPIILVRLPFLGTGREVHEPWSLPEDDAWRSHVYLAGLDSNQSRFLASGSIRDEQLQGLSMTTTRQEAPDNLTTALAHRILVVHHHPVPIPYTPEDLTSFEPFLVLRGAGTLLSQAAMNDFDLILHGHRHVRSFSKLSYNVRNRTLRTMSVLAASSPTASDIPSAAHSYNLVELHHTGRISVQERFNGEGAGSNEARPTPSDDLDAVSHAEQKVRTYERARRVQQIESASIIRSFRINDMAFVENSFRMLGLQVQRDTNDFTYTHEAKVDLGVIDRRTIVLDKGFSTPGVELHCETGPENIETDLPGDPHVGQWMKLTFTVPTIGTRRTADFGAVYTTANNFRLSRWEMTERGEPRTHELVSMRIRLPTKSLRIELTLPDSHKDVGPFLRCLRLASYPLLTIDPDTRLVEFPVATDSLYFDADATAAESKSLSKLGPRTWLLDIDHPQIGYMYELRWEVRDSREDFSDVSIEGETRTIWSSALRRRAAAIERQPTPGKVGDYFTQVLVALLEEFRRRFPSIDERTENSRLCFLTYEEANGRDLKPPRIVAVEEALRGTTVKEIPLKDYWMLFGDGASGLAFKAANPHLYCARSARTPSGGLSPMFALASKLNLQGVLAMPIYHPRAWTRIKGNLDEDRLLAIGDLPTSAETVGVLTFASDSPGTGLTRLHKQGPTSSLGARKIFELQDVVQSAAPALLKGLLE
jgi:3',5'-cyclic AMP phosphodiesterase CpdA